jgi:alkanesulfonate monooxygenase SsuD/methylene tetrahydromethanopterin reductase-like flavin-dependent oxidoreductase (luciferase family)
MQLGFFTMPIHPLTKDWRQCLREDREAFLLADRLGFTEGYVGEHATDQAENITSCALFIASLAEGTKAIRLGTGTVNLPNAHPVAVASQIAMLDHLLEGRFNFGISPGGLLSDAEAFGNLEKDRTAMFVEAIDMVLEIWKRDPPYDLHGKFWTISTARTLIAEIGQGIIAKPLQRPHPPILVTAVAPHSKGLVSAAARGWAPISANFLLPKWVATHWPQYAEGCRTIGAEPEPAAWRVARSVFVADDLRTARDYALGPQSPYRYYYEQIVTKMKRGGRAVLFKEDPAMTDDAVTVDRVLEQLVTWGTPAKVTAEIEAFRETSGECGTLLYAGHDWVDERLARRSMELMATQVMPALVGT